MHLHVSSEEIRLEDQNNFRELDLRASPDLDVAQLRTRLQTLDATCEVDAEHAWIAVATLRGLGQPGDHGWTSAFDAMVAYASGAGWTRDEDRQVRLHVVS